LRTERAGPPHVGKFAVVHNALLEQNLRCTTHALASLRCALPAYSVVKEPCLRSRRSVPTKNIGTIKNPASSAGYLRPDASGRRNSKLDCFLSGVRAQHHSVTYATAHRRLDCKTPLGGTAYSQSASIGTKSGNVKPQRKQIFYRPVQNRRGCGERNFPQSGRIGLS
jgi:hypothetical protein